MFPFNKFARCVFFVFCAIGTQGRPSLPFSLQTFFQNFQNFAPNKDNRQEVKSYSGKRVEENSIRMVYFHDQSVAVVELGPDKLLLNCEIIEIYDQDDLPKALGALQESAKPVQISFEEMVKLSQQCTQLDMMRMKSDNHLPAAPVADEQMKNITQKFEDARQMLNSQFSIFSGIIPGTKWCGTGDIAKNYHELGEDPKVDMCCRNHDLCPVKIRAYSKKYNLTNASLYTKSHCLCDDIFFACMKSQESSRSAQILGNIYFNLVKVPCLEDTDMGKVFRKAKEF